MVSAWATSRRSTEGFHGYGFGRALTRSVEREQEARKRVWREQERATSIKGGLGWQQRCSMCGV